MPEDKEVWLYRAFIEFEDGYKMFEKQESYATPEGAIYALKFDVDNKYLFIKEGVYGPFKVCLKKHLKPEEYNAEMTEEQSKIIQFADK